MLAEGRAERGENGDHGERPALGAAHAFYFGSLFFFFFVFPFFYCFPNEKLGNKRECDPGGRHESAMSGGSSALVGGSDQRVRCTEDRRLESAGLFLSLFFTCQNKQKARKSGMEKLGGATNRGDRSYLSGTRFWGRGSARGGEKLQRKGWRWRRRARVGPKIWR